MNRSVVITGIGAVTPLGNTPGEIITATLTGGSEFQQGFGPFGYAMSFGSNILGGWFGWNRDYFFLRGIDETIMDGGVPEYVFSMFQGKSPNAIIPHQFFSGCDAFRRRFFRPMNVCDNSKNMDYTKRLF